MVGTKRNYVFRAKSCRFGCSPFRTRGPTWGPNLQTRSCFGDPADAQAVSRHDSVVGLVECIIIFISRIARGVGHRRSYRCQNAGELAGYTIMLQATSATTCSPSAVVFSKWSPTPRTHRRRDQE